MGNACIQPGPRRRLAKLIFWGGEIQLLSEKHLAGEVMFMYPDHTVCHADSFFVGRRVPVLSLEDELRGGETYFVLPVDVFPCETLTAAMLARLATRRPNQLAIDFRRCSFEYRKGEDGRVVIKVLPEFLMRVFSEDCGKGRDGEGDVGAVLCSTPELKRQYEQLVRPRNQAWSPKLETITEAKIKSSPGRLLRLEWSRN